MMGTNVDITSLVPSTSIEVEVETSVQLTVEQHALDRRGQGGLHRRRPDDGRVDPADARPARLAH